MRERDAPRRRLLLLFAPADHPHRDAACATLAWLAEDEGSLFECYFESRTSGVHHGGGHPAYAEPADLRGGTFTGGHHLEQFYLLLSQFDCEACCLGPSVFDLPLAEARVRVRAQSTTLATFYMQLFESSTVARPKGLLVVGDGGRPQGVPLGAYAYPEVTNRRLLAVAAGDQEAVAALSPGMNVEWLWVPGASERGSESPEGPQEASVEAQTKWMAERWKDRGRGFMLGDPELVGRWTPTAVREGWNAVFGIPQADLIRRTRDVLSSELVVYGRQQDDRDFLELSRAGAAFQLIDPGRPPFPVVKAAGSQPLHLAPPLDAFDGAPDDAQLSQWADEGKVLATLLFWSGMIRELENLFALADLFSLSGILAGLVLTSESFRYMPRPPLTLAYVPRHLGGLAPQIEVLLASGGVGAFIESETPLERFAAALQKGVADLRDLIGPDRVPKGWWGVMDAPMVPRKRPPRLMREPEPPYFRVRYRRRGDGHSSGSTMPSTVASTRRRDIRSIVRTSPLGRFFEPLRPFDGYEPGAPGKQVLQVVRDAGFEYAFTKSAFAQPSSVVTGISGLTAINYTVGRWDGWTPFVTVNSLADLIHAEKKLLQGGRPGWLTGTLDTCLWAFTGPIWQRGARLRAICDWMVAGGRSGQLINVAPATVARYAKLLDATGRVDRIAAR